MLTQAHLVAQDPSSESKPRFLPHAGITYQVHNLSHHLSVANNDRFSGSHFPGMEVGFTLLPESPSGWTIEYRNTFLLELALYEIVDETANPYNGIMADIVDRTICHGILGEFRTGRPLITTPGRTLSAGFLISDKVILGAESYPIVSYYGIGEDSYTMDGFHFTPGVFASFRQQYLNGMTLSLDLSLAQSLFNLHQFDREAAYENFVHPLFMEVLVKTQFDNGIYLRAGGLMGASFTRLPAAARISAGIGYSFRYR
jgi:hypothetical protein